MSEIDRHKRNVKKMVDAGAPEADIDAYLSGEGVTPEMLRGEAQSPVTQTETPFTDAQKLPEDTPEYRAQLEANMADAQAQSDTAQGQLDVINPVLGAANAGMRFANAATLGVPKRIASTVLEAKDAITGADDVDRHAQLGGDMEQVRQQFPNSSLAADVGGTVAGIGKIAKSGGTALRAVPNSLKGAKGVAATTGALAVDGAAYAGTNALIDGRDAVQEAKEGGAVGAAANLAFKGAGAALKPLVTKVKEGTSPKQLRSLRNAAYKRLDRLGISYEESATRSLKQGLKDDLMNDTIGLDKATHAGTSRLMNDIDKFKGKMTFTKLEQFRKRAQRLAGNPNGGDDAYTASLVAKNIDEFVKSAPATAGRNKDGEVVAQAVQDARELHRRFKGSEAIVATQGAERGTGAIDKAVRRGGGSSGSGSNSDNAIRQNIRAIMDNPKRIKFYNQAERDAMEKIVKGSLGGNMSRLLGKFAPTGNLSTVLSGAAGAALGGPVGVAAVLGGGHGARKLSEKITQKHVDELLHLIRNGEPLERVPNAVGKVALNPENQEAVARLGMGTSLAILGNQ